MGNSLGGEWARELISNVVFRAAILDTRTQETDDQWVNNFQNAVMQSEYFL